MTSPWCGILLIYSFAGSFSEKATRTIRRFSPQLAAKMRPPLAYLPLLLATFLTYLIIILYYIFTVSLYRPVIRGRPSAKRAIYICGQPRWVFVLISSLGMCLYLCLLFDYGTLWDMDFETIWILLFFLFHSEFCPLVYFMWFVHCLFGTTHWASWYAIYTNFHNLFCHSTSSIHMLDDTTIAFFFCCCYLC